MNRSWSARRPTGAVSRIPPDGDGSGPARPGTHAPDRAVGRADAQRTVRARVGGVPPSDRARLDRLRLEASSGSPLTDVGRLPARTRRSLGLAERLGAPLLPALDAVSEAQDDEDRCRRAVDVASAQARAVAAGLLLAPVVLVPGLGALLGADPRGFYGTGLGAFIGAVGLAMLVIGALLVLAIIRRIGRSGRHHTPPWTRSERLLLLGVGGGIWSILGPMSALAAMTILIGVRRRRCRRTITPGLDEAADLLAIAVAAGLGLPHALRCVADELPALAARLRRLANGLELGMPLDVAGPSDVPGDPVRRLAALLQAAEATGAPIGAVLTRLATDLRADELAHVLAAVERLPVALTFPTTLCLLPATVLLIGAPIVHAGLAGLGT